MIARSCNTSFYCYFEGNLASANASLETGITKLIRPIAQYSGGLQKVAPVQLFAYTDLGDRFREKQIYDKAILAYNAGI